MEYVAAFLKTASGKQALMGEIVEAARANVSLANVRKLEIQMPPMQLQNVFCDRIGDLNRLQILHSSSLAELDQLFASLQQRAFRGEL